jgi:hypothetical protein
MTTQIFVKYFPTMKIQNVKFPTSRSHLKVECPGYAGGGGQCFKLIVHTLDNKTSQYCNPRNSPRELPRQVTIFHSLPRQKNAEAIPPVVP